MAAVRVAVFGLGEAGSRIAADLAAAGAQVHGYDPAGVTTPTGVTRHDDPCDAVSGAELVMAVTAAADAEEAAAQAADRLRTGMLYADLATASPQLKAALDDAVTGRGLDFADVALMAPVPGPGLATPSLVSGSGAERYAATINPLGGRVTVVGTEPGAAAARKLLRSIVMKSLAAAAIESLRGAEQLGLDEWLSSHLAEVFAQAGGTLLRRLVDGTATHGERRRAEMEAAAGLLESLGVDPVMSRAAAAAIEEFARSRPQPKS